jgi:hypothetical protein
MTVTATWDLTAAAARARGQQQAGTPEARLVTLP